MSTLGIDTPVAVRLQPDNPVKESRGLIPACLGVVFGLVAQGRWP